MTTSHYEVRGEINTTPTARANYGSLTVQLFEADNLEAVRDWVADHFPLGLPANVEVIDTRSHRVVAV